MSDSPMLRLPAKGWQQYLERITERYRGNIIILRQKEADDDEATVVLWHTPLRSLTIDDSTPGADATLVAGSEAPFIRLSFRAVEQITLTPGPDSELAALRLVSRDSTVSTIGFL